MFSIVLIVFHKPKNLQTKSNFRIFTYQFIMFDLNKLRFKLIWQRLYEEGARNFWIHNTGPLGCLAQNIAKFGTDSTKLDEFGCVSSHNQAAKLFNLQLHAFANKFQAQFPDSDVTYVDIFSIKSNLIANYSRFGKHFAILYEYPKLLLDLNSLEKY